MWRKMEKIYKYINTQYPKNDDVSSPDCGENL